MDVLYEKIIVRGDFLKLLKPIIQMKVDTKRYTKHCILAHVMRSVPKGILHNVPKAYAVRQKETNLSNKTKI